MLNEKSQADLASLGAYTLPPKATKRGQWRFHWSFIEHEKCEERKANPRGDTKIKRRPQAGAISVKSPL